MQEHEKLMDVLRQSKVCSCVDFEVSSSHLHAWIAHDESPKVEKASSTDCDVGELNGLTICFFCCYTIADGGDVFNDKKHRHAHFLGGTKKGNHECKSRPTIYRHVRTYIFLNVYFVASVNVRHGVGRCTCDVYMDVVCKNTYYINLSAVTLQRQPRS